MKNPVLISAEPLEIKNAIDESLSQSIAEDLHNNLSQALSSEQNKNNDIKQVVVNSVLTHLDSKYTIKNKTLAQEIITRSLQSNELANELYTVIDRKEIDRATSVRLTQSIINQLNQQSEIHLIINGDTLQGITDRINTNIRALVQDAQNHKNHTTHLGSIVNALEVSSTMGLTTNGLANMLQSIPKGVAGSAGIGGVNAIINTHLGRSIMRGMEKSQASGFLGRLKDGVASPTSGSLLALWFSAILATGYVDRAASIGAIGITAAANAEVNNRLTKQGGMNDAISSAQSQLPVESDINKLRKNLEQFIKDEEKSGKSGAYNFKYRVINGTFSPHAENISEYNSDKQTVYTKLSKITYPTFVAQLKTLAAKSGLSQTDQIFIQDPTKSYTEKLAYLQNLATEAHTRLKDAAKKMTDRTSTKDENGDFKKIHTNPIFANDVGLAFTSPSQGEEALQDIARMFQETEKTTTNIRRTTDQLAKTYDATLRAIHTTAQETYTNISYNTAPDLSYQVKVPDYAAAVALAQQQIKIDLDNNASMKIIKESFGEENLDKIEAFCLLRGWGIALGLGALSLLGMTWSISRQRKNSEKTRQGLTAYKTLIETIIDSIHMHLNDDLDAIFKSTKEGSQVIPRAHVSSAVWSWIVSINPDMQQYAPATYTAKNSTDAGKLHKIKAFIWQGLIGDTRTENQIKLNELIETFKHAGVTENGKIHAEQLDQILEQLGIHIDKSTSQISIQNLAHSIANKQDILERQFDEIRNLHSSRWKEIEMSQKNVLEADENAHAPEHQKKRMHKALLSQLQEFDQSFSANIEQTLSDEGINSKIRSFRDEMMLYMKTREREIEQNQQNSFGETNAQKPSTPLKTKFNHLLKSTISSIGSLFGNKKSGEKREETNGNVKHVVQEVIKMPKTPFIHTSLNSAYESFKQGHANFSEMIRHLPTTKDGIITLVGNDRKSKSLSDKVWSLVEGIRELDTLNSKAQSAIKVCSQGLQNIYPGDKNNISGYFDFIIKKLAILMPAQRALKAYQKKKMELENLQKDSSKKYILDALNKVNITLSQKRQTEILAIDPAYTEIVTLSSLSADEFDVLKNQVHHDKIEREKVEQTNLFLENLVTNGLIDESEKAGMFEHFFNRTEEERAEIVAYLGIRKHRRDRIIHEGVQAYIPTQNLSNISEESFELMMKKANEQKHKKEVICDPLRDELIKDGLDLNGVDEAQIITAETIEDANRIKQAIKTRHANASAISQLTSEGFQGVILTEDETDVGVILDTFYQQYIIDQLALIDILGSEFEEKIENREQADNFLINILTDVLKKEVPRFIINASLKPESLIQLILRQRIIRENNRLIAKIDEFMTQEGIKEGKESGASLNIRHQFVQEALNQDSPKKFSEADAQKIIEAMRNAHQVQKQKLTDRAQRINDEIGDQKEMLEHGILESLLSLRNTDQEVENHLERINNLMLLLNNSELKIQKWMLSAPQDQYNNLCKILEKVATNLKYADSIKHKISLEAASKLGDIALVRYIDLIQEGDHISLNNEAIVTLINTPDEADYIFGRGEILE